MDLETAPPKLTADIDIKIEEQSQKAKSGKQEKEVIANSVANDTINQSKQDLSSSKIGGKKKKKKKAAEGDFNSEMFELINKVRANPEEFSKKYCR